MTIESSPVTSARQTWTRGPRHGGTRRVSLPAPAGWLALLSILVVCATLVAFAHTRTSALNLNIAAEQLSDLAFSDGIYAMERMPDGQAYRWTSGSAVVQLRGAANAALSYVLIARICAGNPSGPQPLTFLAAGRPLATITPETRFRVYRVLLRPDAAGELRLNLRTATFSDPRPLGVILTDLRIRPLPSLDWSGAMVTALGLLTLAAFLRRAYAPWYDCFAAVALAGFGLVAVAAVYCPAPLPFAALAALFLVAIVVGEVVSLIPHPSSLIPLSRVGFLERPSLFWHQDVENGTCHTRGVFPHHKAIQQKNLPLTALLPRLGMITLALVVSFSGVIWPSWLSDDAFISFRYAQNLAAGNGMVYNIGERVEGYTNFLWTIIAAGVLALGGDIVLWSYVSGVALGLAILLLTYTVAARMQGPAWGLVVALVVGTSQSLLLYTARGAGLETGLFTLLVLAGSACYLAARRRPAMLAAAGAIFALAAMTRPEGVLVFGVTLMSDVRCQMSDWGQCGSRSWRVNLQSTICHLQWLVGAFLLIFLPYYLWRLSYYGDPLPNTFYAKTGGGLRQVLRGLQYAGGFALTLGGPLLLLILLPWLRSWRTALNSWRGYLLPLVLVYSAYIVFVGGDHFRGERFFVPVLPWLAILLADGLAAALPHRPNRLTTMLLALSFSLGGMTALVRTTPIDGTIRGVDESLWIWREIGWWIADQTPPDASLAALGAGAVAYYSQHPVIDLLGLTEKHIARIAVSTMGEGTAGHEKRDPTYILHDRRPTYIPQIWDDYFGGATGLRDRYRLITIVTRSGRNLRMWERIP